MRDEWWLWCLSRGLKCSWPPPGGVCVNPVLPYGRQSAGISQQRSSQVGDASPVRTVQSNCTVPSGGSRWPDGASPVGAEGAFSLVRALWGPNERTGSGGSVPRDRDNGSGARGDALGVLFQVSDYAGELSSGAGVSRCVRTGRSSATRCGRCAAIPGGAGASGTRRSVAAGCPVAPSAAQSPCSQRVSM